MTITRAARDFFGFKIILRPYYDTTHCFTGSLLQLSALPGPTAGDAASFIALPGLASSSGLTLLFNHTNPDLLLFSQFQSSVDPSLSLYIMDGRFFSDTASFRQLTTFELVPPLDPTATDGVSLKVWGTNYYLLQHGSGRLCAQPQRFDADYCRAATLSLDVIDPTNRRPVPYPAADGSCDPTYLNGPAVALYAIPDGSYIQTDLMQFLRARDGGVFLDDREDERTRRESVFRFTAGVADSTRVSIEATWAPGSFLRDNAGVLTLTEWAEDEALRKSATFVPVAGLTGKIQTVSLRAYDDPQRYVVLRGTQLFVERSDGSSTFARRASFHLRYRGPAERFADSIYVAPGDASATDFVEPSIDVYYGLFLNGQCVTVAADARVLADSPSAELWMGTDPRHGSAQFRLEYPPPEAMVYCPQGWRGPFYIRSRNSGQYLVNGADRIVHQHQSGKTLVGLVRTGPRTFRIIMWSSDNAYANVGGRLQVVSGRQNGSEFELIPAREYRGEESSYQISQGSLSLPDMFIRDMLRDIVGDLVGKMAPFPGGSPLFKGILATFMGDSQNAGLLATLGQLHDQIMAEVRAEILAHDAEVAASQIVELSKSYLQVYAADRAARRATLLGGGQAAAAAADSLADLLFGLGNSFLTTLAPLKPSTSPTGEISDSVDNYNRLRAGFGTYVLGAVQRLNILQEYLLLRSCADPQFDFETYIRQSFAAWSWGELKLIRAMWRYLLLKRTDKVVVVCENPAAYTPVYLNDNLLNTVLYYFSGGGVQSVLEGVRSGLRPFYCDNLRWNYENALYPMYRAVQGLATLPTRTLLLCRKLRQDAAYRTWYLTDQPLVEQSAPGRLLSQPPATRMTLPTAPPPPPDPTGLVTSSGRAFAIAMRHSEMCLTVSGGSTTQGTPIVQSVPTGEDNQKFILTYVGNGEFTLTAVHSGQVLDISGGSGADGAALIQWPAIGVANQRFRPVPREGGFYSLVAAHSSKALGIGGGSLADGAAVQQWTDTGVAALQVRLLPTEINNRRVVITGFGPGGASQPLYIEKHGQDARLNGWLEANDWLLAADLYGLGRAQLVHINRGGVGGKLMISDAGRRQPPLDTLYFEVWGESPWLSGWFEDGDLHLCGDFMGLGRDQWLMVNRMVAGGTAVVMQNLWVVDLGSGKPIAQYATELPQGHLLSGWFSSSGRFLVGDFTGARRDQLLCINRSGTGGKLAVFDLAGGAPTRPYYEAWGSSQWIDGWIDENDLQFAGDFLGLGRDQLLCINRAGAGGKLMIADLSSGQPSVRFWETWGDSPLLGGWLEDNDVTLAGDFLGLHHDQLLFINRRPGLCGKVMVVDFITGTPQIAYLEGWSARTSLDGMLLKQQPLLRVGDFCGTGKTQLLCVDDSGAHSTTMLAAPPTAAPGVRLLCRLSTDGNVSFAPGQTAGRGDQSISGLELSLEPSSATLGLEWKAISQSGEESAWTPLGAFAGTTLPFKSFAVRLTGEQAPRFTVRYTSNRGSGCDGSDCGPRGAGLSVTWMRVWLELRR